MARVYILFIRTSVPARWAHHNFQIVLRYRDLEYFYVHFSNSVNAHIICAVFLQPQIRNS